MPVIGQDQTVCFNRIVTSFTKNADLSEEAEVLATKMDWKKTALYLDRLFLAIYLSVTVALVIWIAVMATN